MNKINIALIGCGRVAEHYKFIFKKFNIKNYKIIAVADVDVKKANKFSKHFNCPSFKSINDLINKTRPDVNFILTPSGTHYNLSKISLKSGFNTITEKPMAMLNSECKKLINLAKKEKLMFGTVFQNRFNPAIEFLHNKFKKGKIGKIITANIRLRWCRYQDYYQDGWHGTWKNDGGVINQQAIHHIDILNWLNGPITELCSIGNNSLNKLEAEDTMIAIVKFKNGSMGTIEATTAARPKDFEASLSILSEKGFVEIGGIALNEIVAYQIIDDNEDEKSIIKKYSQKVPNGYGLSHYYYIQKVIDNLLKGLNKPPIDAKQSWETTSVIHSIYKSYENKKWIKIKDKLESKLLGK